MLNELEQFLTAWDVEYQNTLKMLKSLATSQYDFRPDKGGRSLGELSWHLAEVEAYGTYGFETGAFKIESKPPGIERPRAIADLAPGYERIHRDAVAGVRKLKPEDLDRSLTFFDGQPRTISRILWGGVLMHLIHHRGQLSLMNRIAGGISPGVYGPNREEMAVMMSAMKGQGGRN